MKKETIKDVAFSLSMVGLVFILTLLIAMAADFYFNRTYITVPSQTESESETK